MSERDGSADRSPEVLDYQPPRPTGAILRFRLWCFVVLALVATDVLVLHDLFNLRRYHTWRVAMPLSNLLVLMLWWLLSTTPTDALRLKRRTSLIVIGSITAAFAVTVYVAVPDTDRAPLTPLLWAAFAAVAVIGAWRRRESLWWATLFALHPSPIVLINYAESQEGVDLLAVATGCVFFAAFGARWPRVSGAMLVAAFVISLVVAARR